MKKYFIDNIHVMTDYMGGWNDQWIEIGWYDDQSHSYFNLDEVKEIYEKGEADNVGIREDGSLYMKSKWLDARTAFSIICGIPFGVHSENENLLVYAKKIGLVKENPIPIRMYSGTKYLEIREDGLYTVKYTLDKSKFFDPVVDFIEKMCVGRIKRLKNRTYTYCHGGVNEEKHYFTCGNVSFDKNNLTLIIDKIPYEQVYKRELIDSIRNMDLEFLISNSNLVNFSNVLSACHDWCRDHGQFHWIGDYNKEKEENSNVYWFNK